MSTPITIAPHLQRALDVMSRDMSVAPEALINQAVFAWLRINGYVLPGQGAAVEAPAVVAPAPVPAPVPVPVPAPAPEPVAAPEAEAAVAPPVFSPTPAPVATTTPAPSVPAPAPAVEKAPDRAPALARMAEIEADLEQLAKPWPAWPPEPEPEADEEPEPEDAPSDDADADEEPDHTGETPVADEDAAADEAEEDAPADDLPVDEEEEVERAAAPPAEEPEQEEEPEPPAESTIVLKQMPIVLYLQRGEEEPIRIDKERFIIGRGPHCDLIIDSPRVSREHVALTRSGIMYFLEDLNSSNGTWFNEERVTKRELESGDVISLGNEPVTFILRGE